MLLFQAEYTETLQAGNTMRREKIRRGKIFFKTFLLVLAAFLCLAVFVRRVRDYFGMRGHGAVRTESYEFTESDRQLKNPNRGFYHMHGFVITDAPADYSDEFAWRFSHDQDTSLAMIEINLQSYRSGSISEAGLSNIESLLDTMESLDKHYIVRPLYDWDGENESVEPESLDIILEHMEQIGPLLSEHKDIIFTLQGLFIGNWGEMNGTGYLEIDQLRSLADTLAASTADDMFLAVRMPMQWRMITDIAEPGDVTAYDGSLAARLGLFNDGMLGSYSDYGTYGNHSKEKDGYLTYWNREEELGFQDILCGMVPIGGEVMVDNPYNDLENAVSDMKRMHVTYINRDFDMNVLDKWTETTVSESGCFDGMDGLSYIERHLGYRLLIDDISMNYDFAEDILTIKVNMQNVGFAPVYKEADARIILRDEAEGRSLAYEFSQDVRELKGGNHSDETKGFSIDIPLRGEQEGHFDVYFEITDKTTGERLLFANEQDQTEYGYSIGSVDLESIEEYKERWMAEHLAFLSASGNK